jgi:hypothetical protein
MMPVSAQDLVYWFERDNGDWDLGEEKQILDAGFW